jgi:hypothetical protein
MPVPTSLNTDGKNVQAISGVRAMNDKQEMEQQADNPHLDALREQSYALITIKPRQHRQQSRVVQAQRKIEERKREV